MDSLCHWTLHAAALRIEFTIHIYIIDTNNLKRRGVLLSENSLILSASVVYKPGTLTFMVKDLHFVGDACIPQPPILLKEGNYWNFSLFLNKFWKRVPFFLSTPSPVEEISSFIVLPSVASFFFFCHIFRNTFFLRPKGLDRDVWTQWYHF